MKHGSGTLAVISSKGRSIVRGTWSFGKLEGEVIQIQNFWFDWLFRFMKKINSSLFKEPIRMASAMDSVSSRTKMERSFGWEPF
jgi:hypothetical protein